MNSFSRAGLAVIAVTGAACVLRAAMMEGTVAMVNSTPIMLSEYQKQLAIAIDYWRRAEPEAMQDPANVKKLRESTLEELINRELLHQEGTKKKLKVRVKHTRMRCKKRETIISPHMPKRSPISKQHKKEK